MNYIQDNNGHQILNVIKDNSREWNIKEAYPRGEHPEDTACRRNIPIYDRIRQKMLSFTSLASNTFQQILTSHFSESILQEI